MEVFLRQTLMIRITRIWQATAGKKDTEHYTTALELKGHAELAPSGQDILCAAVSVLSENLAASLKTLLELPVEIKAEKGLYAIQLPPKHVSKESELLFSAALLGLGVLAKQYPDRIELKEKEKQHGS